MLLYWCSKELLQQRRLHIMTRKQALEDLFLAVKRHLLNSGSRKGDV